MSGAGGPSEPGGGLERERIVREMCEGERALGDSFLVEKQLMGKRAGAATEDNNHRVVRVGRDLCRLSSPSPMLLDSQDAGPFACFGPKEGCWVCSAAVSAPPRLEA